MDANESQLRAWTKVLRKAVHHYAGVFGLDYNDAEDCLVAIEEAIARDPERFARSLGGAGEEAALWRIAWYRVRKAIARRNGSRMDTCFILDVSTAHAKRGSFEAASPAPGPEELFLHMERLETMRGALNSLPKKQRELWEQVEINGENVSDVAAATGRSSGAIRAALCAIRKKLRRLLVCLMD